jgi:predicted house-cleaning noncanonical NTP pyrophosphatase (MazG superfamily)
MDFKPTNLPIESEYPKLVRDNIPAIIKAKEGIDVKARILEDDEEYLKYLLKKMVEEATELQHSEKVGNTREELADVLEIINSILKLKNWTMEDIAKVQKDKREKNGGFEKRILMLCKGLK